jgi:arginase
LCVFAVLEAPSVLGLFPAGVESAPRALLAAGLADRLGARHAGVVPSPPWEPDIDPATGLRNARGLREHALALADATGTVLDAGDTPVVLGGDCSIVLGNLLALRRRGRHGLLFVDGHADFYQPDAEPNGEAASMDLALATGRGPDVVTVLDGRSPLVREEDVVQVGRRDAEEAEAAGSLRIEDSHIAVLDLAAVRRDGAGRVAQEAIARLGRPDLHGFWAHLDCDAVDDALMPAVDYRLPGGLSWEEVTVILGAAFDTGRMVGLDVTIYNPTLDPTGAAAEALVDCLVTALVPF